MLNFELMKMDFMQMQVSPAGFFGLLDAVFAMIITIVVYLYSMKKSRGCLDPGSFKEFKLIKRTPISHNTVKFRFALPNPTSKLGLPVGQHILCKGEDSEGNEVIRPYTPITLDSDVGYFELVVKISKRKNVSPFQEMHEGEYLPVKGPKGRFKYKVGKARAFGMIAGGTGIAPMFQLTRAILENPKNKTNVHLIYVNVTVGGILLKVVNENAFKIGSEKCLQDELDSFATNFPNRFKVYYVLSQILRYGPPGMNKAMADHLNALGYTSDMLFEF